MLAESATVPEELDWLNTPPPASRKFAPEAIVSAPVWLITTGPAAAVPTAPLKVKLVPAKLIPPRAVVFNAPKEVAPVPALCKIDAAVIAPVVTLLADEIVRTLSGLIPPIAPLLAVMLPDPATKVRERGVTISLSTDPDSVMLPAPAPVLNMTLLVSSTAFAKEIPLVFVVIFALIELEPPPDC